MIVKNLITYSQFETVKFVLVSLKAIYLTMKKIFTAFCFTAATLFAVGQTNTISTIKDDKTTTVAAETLSLTETEYNFGKIPQGKPVTHVFTFTNSGNTPLTINTILTSCGCTTPEYSRDAVPAGESANITVGYNAMAEGGFTKQITITYNGSQTKIINIKGEVWKTPNTSAPENAGINLLKNK